MLQAIPAVVLATLLVLLPLHARQPPPDDQVRFRWAFGALTGPSGARTLVRVTDDITLKTGDEIKMLVSPVTSCFVYVVHEDPKGVVAPLFPETPDGFPAGYKAGARYSIPADGGWLTLDAVTGIERIYLTASPARLPRLEAAVTRGSRVEVIAELAALRKQHAKADWIERPVQIGGQVRGLKGPDITSMAIEITAQGFYSRVFVIDHR
jgi:hypothetical protein